MEERMEETPVLLVSGIDVFKFFSFVMLESLPVALEWQG